MYFDNKIMKLNKKTKIFILAGETSGDYIGSCIMKGVKQNNNNICVTYWINKLQRIKSDKPILVTLNPQLNSLPSKQEIIKKLSFRHPVLDKNYLKAQNEINSIQGKNNTYFTGAWLGYGFHEDGVKSSSIIAKKLNLIK